ncbi:M10 family metallopeptidase [Loktanella sp. DJP18]|uniref:M10 family metallopeptidase n=1 Tax=Loktanella sp. DJP18 TaxID=3409788 RepID=UPI003BB51810
MMFQYASLRPPVPLSSLTWGTQVPQNQVSVFLAPAGIRLDGVTSEGFNAYERGQIMAVLDALEAVADLHFILTNDLGADMQLVLDTNEMTGGYLAYFNPPGTFNAGIGVFNGNLWDRIPGGDLEQGGAGYATIIHELLHGLGLAHPHDDGGTSTIMSGVMQDVGDYGRNDLNQGVFTAMSYNGGCRTGPASSSPTGPAMGFETTPMALDIAVLQQLYGANADHAGGRDIYWLPWGNKSGTGWSAIWDTGGNDTLRYDGWRDVTLDLRAAQLIDVPGGGGFVSYAHGVQGGVTIAAGVTIENARGGCGDDRLNGNGTDNHLLGFAGSDWIRGREGDDTLRGGGGADRLSGGAGDDRLVGGGGADKITGGRGSDFLTGGLGRDRFDFNSIRDSRPGSADTIMDYQPDRDIIDLRSIDADAIRPGNQAFFFIESGTFERAGQLRFHISDDDLWITADRDGDGGDDLTIVLQHVGVINAGDILL